MMNKSLVPTVLVAAVLLVGSLYLAYSAGYFGTLPGEKGTWKSLFERTASERDELAGDLDAEEEESESWRNQSLLMEMSRDEWEARYWDESKTLSTLYSQHQLLESAYNDTLAERTEFETLYADQVQATKMAEDKNARLSADLATVTHERDEWRSLYNASQDDLKGLASAYNQKVKELASMADSRDEWKALYDDVKESRDECESSYLEAESLYNNLTAAFDDLNAAHSALSEDYSTLSNLYDYLSSQNTDLKSDLDLARLEYSSLLGDYDSLLSDLSDLQADYDLLEEDYEWLDAFWMAYVAWYRVRTGMGEDARQMITPDDPTVSSKRSDILGYLADGYLTWDDMEYLHAWVAGNIAYNYDTAVWNHLSRTDFYEYWQSPSRTIAEGRGDCEDQANLLLSLFLAEEDVGWAYCAELEFQDGGQHIVVVIDVVGDEMYIFDPTWDWHSSGSGSMRSKVSEYSAKVQDEGHGSVARISRIYNVGNYATFDDLEDFYSRF